MATPDAANLYLGAGEIWFNRFTAGTTTKTQWRHLGNVSSFELTNTADTIERRSAMSGSRSILKKVVTGTSAEIAMVLDEWDTHNVALGLLGTSAAFSQGSGTATDAAITGTVKKGDWLDTGYLKITVTGVKKSPSTALVLGTDYAVDSDTGMIRILPTSSTVADGDSLLWSGSYPAITSTQIQAMATTQIEGALRFRSASDAVGPRYLIDFHIVSVLPDGAMALLTTDFGTVNLRATVQEDTSKAVGQRQYKLVQL